MSAQPVSATIQRFPYANEAKKIIVARLLEAEGEAVAKHFKEFWKVHNKQNGNYLVDRDYFAVPKSILDADVEYGLRKLFASEFKDKFGKPTIAIQLEQIQAPANQILVGARAPEPSCFGGACRNCPLQKA